MTATRGPTARIDWTPEMDETIRAGRSERQTWVQIGALLRLSPATVYARAKVLGCAGRMAGHIGEAEPRRMRDKPWPHMDFDEYDLDDRDRPSLPIGHELSWAILTANTVLAGQPYPALNERNIP